jgi:hypothetical protein
MASSLTGTLTRLCGLNDNDRQKLSDACEHAGGAGDGPVACMDGGSPRRPEAAGALPGLVYCDQLFPRDAYRKRRLHPYGLRLDLLAKAQGVRSSMRLLGWPAAIASSVSTR